MPAPAFTLGLITHNSAAWLDGFVRSWNVMYATMGWDENRVQVVVADDASTDATVAIVRQLMPQASILTVPAPVGFSAGANRILQTAATEWILLCNPDLTFPVDFLRQIVSRGVDRAPKDVGLYVPRLLNPDGSTQPSVGRFPTIAGLIADQFRPRPKRKYIFPQPSVGTRIDWGMGACLVCRTEALQKVGGLDEKYFLYVEEVDLQKRLADAGYETWFVPECTVTHHQPNANRPARPEVQRWAAAGVLRYFAKFGNSFQLAACRVLMLASRRLPVSWALASRRTLLERPTNFTG